MGTENGEVSFWNVNRPRSQWTDECPDYLAGLDASDKAQLAIRDEDYTPMTWEQVQQLVATNHLELFKRIPSDLHKYRKYIKEVKVTHGSVMNFIMEKRLKWADTVPSGSPFEHPADSRILYNDWPYGIGRDIVHLVVWTKFGFQEDSSTGDLTHEARALIEGYVMNTFSKGHERSKLLWFKNWSALKSVHAIEHFHVMLYRPDPHFIEQITEGDVPMSQRKQ